MAFGYLVSQKSFFFSPKLLLARVKSHNTLLVVWLGSQETTTLMAMTRRNETFMLPLRSHWCSERILFYFLIFFIGLLFSLEKPHTISHSTQKV